MKHIICALLLSILHQYSYVQDEAVKIQLGSGEKALAGVLSKGHKMPFDGNSV